MSEDWPCLFSFRLDKTAAAGLSHSVTYRTYSVEYWVLCDS